MGMHFSTDLGGTQLQKFRFVSYVKKATKYVVSFDNPDFVGDAVADATWPPPAGGDEDDGIEVETSVTYEPSVLGDVHGVMFLKSPEGGVYTVNLHGNCVAPTSREVCRYLSRTCSQKTKNSPSPLIILVSPSTS